MWEISACGCHGSGKWLVNIISTCDTIVGGLRRASGDMAVSSEHGVLLGQYRLLAWITKNQHALLAYMVVLWVHAGWHGR